MNDDEELSAADEARVRALLAAAKHDEPMPDAVVARLDRVLAGLAEEGAPPLANVVPLADRRRRAARMLVAAAAIVVLGVGIGQVVSNGHSSDEPSAGGDAGAPALAPGAPTDTRTSQDSAESSSAGGGAANLPQPSGSQQYDSLDAPAFELRPQHFAQDTRKVQSRALRMTSDLSSRKAYCSPGAWGSGTYVPVDYGQAPAYLVLRRPSGDSQVADLFLCDGDEPVRSVTLPGP